MYTDSHVHFERRLYSVPWRLINQEVWVRATSNTVAIYSNDDARVATHTRRGRTNGARRTADAAICGTEARVTGSSGAEQLGINVGLFVREVFSSDDVLLQLRAVQAIVAYLENFPTERANAAARRARFYGSYSYQAIKNILLKAPDLEPLPTSASKSAWTGSPRFAPDITTLVRASHEHP